MVGEQSKTSFAEEATTLGGRSAYNHSLAHLDSGMKKIEKILSSVY